LFAAMAVLVVLTFIGAIWFVWSRKAQDVSGKPAS
jgi:hypothetical protein